MSVAQKSELYDFLPRYFRVIGHATTSNVEKTLERLRVSGPGKVAPAYPIRWLPNGFFAVPGTLSMSSLGGEEGPVSCGAYPMDAASGLSVVALLGDLLDENNENSSQSYKVCDICCCPGSKSQMICDILSLSSSSSSNSSMSKSLLVGVDISSNRMQVCKSLLRKSLVSLKFSEDDEETRTQRSFRSGVRQLLFLGDGTTFGPRHRGSLVFDSNILESEMESIGSRQRVNKRAKQREIKRLKVAEQEFLSSSTTSLISSSLPKTSYESFSSSSLSTSSSNNADEILNPFCEFDAVLVDAECTHDGSYRHLRYTQKSNCDVSYEDNGDDAGDYRDEMIEVMEQKQNLKPNASQSYLDPCRLERIEKLQRDLIQNGLRILKPGGVLVYSTCSLQERQNEDVIRWLLAEEPCAELIPIIFKPKKKNDNDDNEEAESETEADVVVQQLLKLPNSDSCSLFESLPSREKMQTVERLAQHIARKKIPPSEPGTIPGTIRMSRRTGTSGLFIAKLRKIQISG